MTIKDIELRSGMTRANIRYYESLGLLSPARSENGYRDYSEADLDTLLKIKLLRSLEVSLEDIGALSRGEAELGSVLSHQLEALARKEQELRQARELCRQMQADAADYKNLDAAHYLELMRPGNAIASVRQSDKLESAAVPLRRFLARGLDGFIWNTLINVFLLICGVNISKLGNGGDFFITLLGIALMIFVEPLLLHTWGTTPGKWLMGLYVRCYDGTKPDYYEGLYRTWGVFRYGEGFYIPIYNLYRLYRSSIDCGDGEFLPWEEDCRVCIRDEKPWRWVAVIGGYALCFAAAFFGAVIAVMPPNRGDITVAEFVENYNDYADFASETDYVLTADGNFERPPQPGNAAVIEVTPMDKPVFSFTEENGVMTGFTISVHTNSPEKWPQSCGNEISIAVQSYIYATRGGMFSDDLDGLIDQLNEHPFEDFFFTVRGCTLKADYEIEGYSKTGGSYLWPGSDDTKHSYSLVFTLSSNN